MRTNRGFTLFDLLVCIAISAILMGIGLPGLSNLFAKYQSDATAHSIWRALAKTRESAVMSGDKATFCGIDETGRCTRNNMHTLMVFYDHDENRQFDDNDQAIARIELNYTGNIRLEASSNAHFIRYGNNGRPQPWGSIILCHNSGKDELIRRVTSNRAGRNYLARDLNGDGIIAAYDGAAIDC